MIDETDSLATVVTKLKRKYRLSYARIGRVAGISRSGVKQIADGTSRHPNAETLCRLAVALVADPYDDSIEREALADALVAIGRASGYGDLLAVYVRPQLPVLLACLTADLAAARAWRDCIEHHASATSEDVRGIRAQITATRPRTARPHQPS